MSVGVYLRPKRENQLLEETSVRDYIRYTAEVITCISCAVFVFFQQGKELKAEGVKGFVKSLVRKLCKKRYLLPYFTFVSASSSRKGNIFIRQHFNFMLHSVENFKLN